MDTGIEPKWETATLRLKVAVRIDGKVRCIL